MSRVRVVAFSATDKGRVREGNEDSFYVGSTVFAVADGMGGHQAGEVASEMALEPVEALDGRTFADGQQAESALREALRAANAGVMAKAAAEPGLRGMGTTLTAVLVREGALHLAHVGDSRAYLLQPGEGISQLTMDHTLVERLVQEGRLSRDEVATHPQRSVITRAIGVERDVEVDTDVFGLEPGLQVLLCSDGLSGVVDDEQIAEILETSEDGDTAVQRLLDAANEGGGPDNITAVLLRVEPAEADDATSDLGVRPGVTPEIKIRTREESGEAWSAQQMGRVIAPQGAQAHWSGGEQVSRGRRLAAVAISVVVLLTLLVGGGWLLLSRAYFVGEDDGRVALFRGLPGDVAGVRLSWVVERSDVDTAELAPLRRDRLAEGIHVASAAEGRDAIAAYREEAEERAEPTPSPTPSPSPLTLPSAPTPTPAVTPATVPTGGSPPRSEPATSPTTTP